MKANKNINLWKEKTKWWLRIFSLLIMILRLVNSNLLDHHHVWTQYEDVHLQNQFMKFLTPDSVKESIHQKDLQTNKKGNN